MSVEYRTEGRIAVLTLNRPEALNALDGDTYEALNEAVDRFARDPEIWAAIITGAGRAFCAGGDLFHAKSLVENGGWRSALDSFDLQLFGECITAKPIIAAINGPCVGDGVNIALACDIRISARSATFAIGGSRLGMPSTHGAIRCPRIMGLGHAMEFLLFGEVKDADWAFRTGLVNELVDDDALIEAALAWASRLTAIGPLAVRCTKELALRQYQLGFDDAVRLGQTLRERILDSFDAQEGLRAFIEGRPPEFSGT